MPWGRSAPVNALYKNNLAISGLSELYHQNSTASGDNAAAYDNVNRLVGFVRGTLSSSGNNGSGLDTVSTLSSLAQHSENWTLDTLGNWSSRSADGTTTSRTHNSKNELTAVASNSLTFDNNGNTSTDQNGNTYIYDAWNCLKTVKNSGGTTLASYSYDARGGRVQEIHGSTTTDCYFSNRWQVIEERQSSSVTDQYVWSRVYVDGLVLRDDNSTSGNLGISGSGLGRRLYAQQDANWNTTSLVNATGAVQERFAYDPYGNSAVLTSSGTFSTDSYAWAYLHQGGRLDTATGNYIFRHRDYSAALGRWMETDSVRYLDGLNLYQALRSNPATRTDPFGFADQDSLQGPWDPDWFDFWQDPSNVEALMQANEERALEIWSQIEATGAAAAAAAAASGGGAAGCIGTVAASPAAPIAGVTMFGAGLGMGINALTGNLIPNTLGNHLGWVFGGSPPPGYNPNPGPYQPPVPPQPPGRRWWGGYGGMNPNPPPGWPQLP